MAVAVVAAGVQVLLTHDDLRNRRRYLNARATLNGLLTLDVLPVVNENDTVAVDELKLGDNDNLPAIVAALFDADLLLIAYDVAALYAANPRRDPAAARIARVEAISPAVTAMAGGSNSTVGTGGMRTKLEAGIPTALSDGRDAATVQALAQGWLHGTLVCAPAPACRHANTGCATPRHAPPASAADASASTKVRLARSREVVLRS